MSQYPTRKDKTCLNCNHVVDLRFCPNCGQENTDTRKTFHHLFVHFFEDLTHYENAFWKTIRNLLFKPASLTKEYLSGKRLSYLAPVRLYIFISIITFFLIAVIPTKDTDSSIVKVKETEKGDSKQAFYNLDEELEKARIKDSIEDDSIAKVKINQELLKLEKLKEKGLLTDREIDSMKQFITKVQKKKSNNNPLNFGYNSIEQMDSIRKVNPDEINDLEYWLNKKSIPINEKYSQEEFIQEFTEEAERNFPKTLFIYMPLFAFILWLLHNKKRWYYFDHGIFTLHYFSFLLLVTLLLYLINAVLSYCGDFVLIRILRGIISSVGYIWMVYYFFPAHHRFYGESRVLSFIKSCFIYFVNIILFSIILIIFFVYTFINLH